MLLVIDRSALLAAASKGRQLYVHAVPLIYRQVPLHEKVEWYKLLLQRLTKDESRLPIFVRDIFINHGDWLDEGTFGLVVELILRAKCLETLSWSRAIALMSPSESCKGCKSRAQEQDSLLMLKGVQVGHDI